MTRSRRSALAAAVLFALGVAVALADYRESFERGIKAIDNKDWVGAIAALRESIAEKPAEGERVLIYGMRFKPYLPHYYLGVAHFNTGNCDAAMKAWAESERQGAVKQTVEYRTLQSLREQCRGQGAREAEAPPPTRPAPAPAPGPDVKQAVAEAESEIKKGENAATAVARLRAEPENIRVWQSEPSLREGENKAARDLASARTLLAEARSANDPARIGQAREAAGRARQEFESLQKLVAERRDRFEREARDRQARENERARQAAIEKQAREKEARDKQAALDLQAKEKLAKEKAAAGKTVARPTAAPQVVAKQAPAIPPSPVPEKKLPAALLQAAAAYFEGDYGKAAETLRDADFQDSRAAAQASLIRGAARFGIYVTGGEKDESLKNQAVEDIRESLRLDPKIAVTTKAFSPRFVEFFKRSGSQARG